MIHRIDKYILKELLTHEEVNFSDLKPTGVESNTLTYRLKRLVNEGLVGKTKDGLYYLTSKGRFFTDSLNITQFSPRKIPRSIVLLVCRSGDKWLLYRRATHPLRGYLGLPHANIELGKTVFVSANERLKKLGVETDLKFRGTGYLTFFKKGILESYTQVCILENSSKIKTFPHTKAIDELGEYEWIDSPNFTEAPYLPSLTLIKELLEDSKEPFFFETTYSLPAMDVD